MRLVIQRVKSAKVTVGQDISGEIEIGLFVLLGVKKGDSKSDVDLLAHKLVKLRIMSDATDKMNMTVNDIGGKFLIVSQFTLHANTQDGNRPSFIQAEEPSKAQKLYDYFIEKMKSLGAEVETGSFGEYMKIESQLDGPVTILLDS